MGHHDFPQTHLKMSPEQETQFLVAEIRNAQAQSAALMAAIVALLAFQENKQVFKSMLPLPWPFILAAGAIYLTAGFYLLNGLRIAGINVVYYGEAQDGVFVAIRGLRMLTRRMYLTRTVLGLVLFVMIAALFLVWARSSG